VVGLQGGVLFFEQRVGLLQQRVVLFERAAAGALGVQIEGEALESAVSVREAVLQQPLESGFSVSLVPAPALFVFCASVAAAHAVLDPQPSQGKRRRDSGPATNGLPQRTRIHDHSPPRFRTPLLVCCA